MRSQNWRHLSIAQHIGHSFCANIALIEFQPGGIKSAVRRGVACIESLFTKLFIVEVFRQVSQQSEVGKCASNRCCLGWSNAVENLNQAIHFGVALGDIKRSQARLFYQLINLLAFLFRNYLTEDSTEEPDVIA